MLQYLLHYGIHIGVPFLIAFLLYREKFMQVSFFLLLGILIDLDHLIASPVFDPQRCSINFHPLHSYPAIIIYVALVLLKRTRILGIALLIHIIADMVDCLFIG